MKMKQTRRSFLTAAGAGLASAIVPKHASAATLKDFTDIVFQKLGGNAVGVQLAVANAYAGVEKRHSGYARLYHSGNPRFMSDTDTLAIASVSKTISAIAMIRALYDNASADATLESPFYKYLPSHWTVAPNLQSVKFRSLLNHTTGIRSKHQMSYGALKSRTFDGREDINEPNYNPTVQSRYFYTSTNYAYTRLLIPRLSGASIAQYSPITPNYLLQPLEQVQTAQYATSYMSYVQSKVWDKINIAPNMQCKPVGTYPALGYAEDEFSTVGTDFGDRTLDCGSGGWQANAAQLATLLCILHENNSILPAGYAAKMSNELLGYDWNGFTKKQNIFYWGKGGDYPADPYGGDVHTRVWGFANGIYVAVIINSPFSRVVDNKTVSVNASILEAFESMSW